MTRTRLAVLAFACASAVFALPVRAAADVRLTPFAGVTFIDDDPRPTFGAALTAGGLVSVELDWSRAWLGTLVELPAGVASIDIKAHSTTYMGNLVVRVPVGPIQPYVSGGAGIVRVTGSLDVPFLGSLVSVSAQDFGWNVGGGLYVLAGPIGVRADVRRFQTGDLSWDDITGLDDLDSIPLPKFEFWRATGGITLRF